MKYTNSNKDSSYAIFYYGEEDRIGRPGVVETRNGKIVRFKFFNNSHWEEFDRNYLKSQNITLITFRSGVTCCII